MGKAEIGLALALQGVPSGDRLGFIDSNFDCSTVCPTVPRLVGIWQKWHGSWAKWWNTQMKVNQTQVYDQMKHPVLVTSATQVHCPIYLVVAASPPSA